MTKRVLWVVLLAGLLIAGCAAKPAETAAPEAGYATVDIEEFKTMMDNKDFVLVNVHIPFEGDLPDTDLSIAYNEIDQYLDELPAEKDAKIVLYCKSGGMSITAAETLAKLGFTNVYHVEGGFTGWEAAGYPMAE